MTLTKVQKDSLKKYNEDSAKKRRDTKLLVRESNLEGRAQDIANDCAQHAPNHSKFEIGKVEDKIAKLEAMDVRRNSQLNDEANNLKSKHKKIPLGFKDKYAGDIKELKKLLTTLKELPKEPTAPNLG